MLDFDAVYNIENNNEALRVLHFLQKVDRNFIPALSERVDLINYSNKLAINGENLFVVLQGEDIGHASAYINTEQDSFLSSIAVIKEFHGKKIAANLLLSIIQLCKNKKSKALYLEVSKNNKNAQSLYLKLGFQIKSEQNGYYIMALLFND